jgi:hypothetical protein
VAQVDVHRPHVGDRREAPALALADRQRRLPAAQREAGEVGHVDRIDPPRGASSPSWAASAAGRGDEFDDDTHAAAAYQPSQDDAEV